jgi:hypothetical protein
MVQVRACLRAVCKAAPQGPQGLPHRTARSVRANRAAPSITDTCISAATCAPWTVVWLSGGLCGQVGTCPPWARRRLCQCRPGSDAADGPAGRVFVGWWSANLPAVRRTETETGPARLSGGDVPTSLSLSGSCHRQIVTRTSRDGLCGYLVAAGGYSVARGHLRRRGAVTGGEVVRSDRGRAGRSGLWLVNRLPELSCVLRRGARGAGLAFEAAAVAPRAAGGELPGWPVVTQAASDRFRGRAAAWIFGR